MSIGFAIGNNDGQFAQGEHDILLDNIGRLVVLRGRDKLIADVQKILFTERNYFYSSYGTILDDYIGQALPVDTIKSQLAERVVDSLVYLQMLQQGQAKYQPIDAGEMLKSIDSVLVTYMGDVDSYPDALTTFQIAVNLTNGSGESLQVTTYSGTGS